MQSISLVAALAWGAPLGFVTIAALGSLISRRLREALRKGLFGLEALPALESGQTTDDAWLAPRGSALQAAQHALELDQSPGVRHRGETADVQTFIA